MRAGSALLLAMFACLSACRLEAELVDVPTSGARAALVVAVPAAGALGALGAPPTIDAVDLPSPDDLRFPLLEPVDALYVLGYGCALDVLGLGEGRVPSGGERPIPLPRSAQARDDGGAWMDAPRPIAALSALRLPGPPPSGCATLASDAVALPGTELDSPEATVGLGDGRLLVATSSGRAFVVDGGQVSMVALSTSGPHVGLFREDGGEIVALTFEGRTVRGTLEGGFRAGPSLTTRGPLAETWLDGGGDELFVLTPDGHFERSAGGGAFERLDEGDLGTIGSGGVAWVGPGEALAIGLGGGAYSYYVRGNYRRLRAELATADDFEAIARVPGLGVVAGTQQGFLYRWVDGQWEPLGGRSISPQMRVVSAIEGRLFFGGNGGAMWQLVPDTGELCGPTSFAPSGVRFVVPFAGGAFLMSRDRAGMQPTLVTRVRAVAADACGPEVP